MAFFIGIDVGTGSARAGLFDETGRLIVSAKRPIAIWHEPGDIVEQSSSDVWGAIVASVREAMTSANADAGDIAGIGFDATCSLVLVDKDGMPVAVGAAGDAERNIIVWMDHRAQDQTRRINATKHAVLNYVGGVISPEMETPKLLWLAENLPESFAKAAHFFDLADWLTFRATDDLARSICTVTCKWTYLAHENRWDESYFRTIGLGALADEGFARIGTNIVAPGTRIGSGLTARAASELGLNQGTPVAASLIDAHAGGIGSIGARGLDGQPTDPTTQLAYIFGTSACAMATTKEPRFVAGVWGPYFSAMMPGLWLNEGGQSAAGAAIDHLITLHPAHAETDLIAKSEGKSLLGWLESRIHTMAPTSEDVAGLAAHIHVVPEFLGNRAPHADPDAGAVISGLNLDDTPDSLAVLYLAGVAGLGYGARQIVEALAAQQIAIDTIMLSGGAGRSPLVRQILADATGLKVAVPVTEEPVMLGAAILGAVASGAFPSITAAMAAMSRLGAEYSPAGGATQRIHDAKYGVFLRLQDEDRSARAAMAAALSPKLPPALP